MRECAEEPVSAVSRIPRVVSEEINYRTDPGTALRKGVGGHGSSSGGDEIVRAELTAFLNDGPAEGLQTIRSSAEKPPVHAPADCISAIRIVHIRKAHDG